MQKVVSFVLILLLGAAVWALANYTLKVEQAAQYASEMGDATTGFVIVNGVGDIVEWSSGAEKITGWTFSDAHGSALEKFMPSDKRDAHRQSFRRAIANWPATTPHVTCTIIGKSGNAVRVSISLWKLGESRYCGVMRGK